jgi:hypothetical protein
MVTAKNLQTVRSCGRVAQARAAYSRLCGWQRECVDCYTGTGVKRERGLNDPMVSTQMQQGLERVIVHTLHTTHRCVQEEGGLLRNPRLEVRQPPLWTDHSSDTTPHPPVSSQRLSAAAAAVLAVISALSMVLNEPGSRGAPPAGFRGLAEPQGCGHTPDS